MNISKIISGKPDRGLNKYMLEEVYFSESCFNKDAYNPQNARFVNGRYYYDLPDFWYNNLSNNKAIALRKIDIHAPSMNISCDVVFKRIKNGSTGAVEKKSCTVALSISPGTSTNQILKEICREVNKELSPSGPKRWRSDPEYTMRLVSDYRYETNEALFVVQRTFPYGAQENEYFIGYEIINASNDLLNLLHAQNAQFDTQVLRPPTNASDGTKAIYFPKVWNREFCFVHASFVNGTSFNYLGRSGEFYPKPSKMYRFGGSSQQFYFELSYDGRTPIQHTLGNFCIDLAFIYHDKDYQAE